MSLIFFSTEVQLRCSMSSISASTQFFLNKKKVLNKQFKQFSHDTVANNNIFISDQMKQELA